MSRAPPVTTLSTGDAVDVDAVGTYVITYDCKDSSDNAAVQVTR